MGGDAARVEFDKLRYDATDAAYAARAEEVSL